MPVPDTDTGGCVEKTKADERTLVKELGKLIPYLRKKGCSLVCTALRPKHRRAAVSRAKRLVIRTLGRCEGVTLCIPADACPVLEG